MDRHRWNPFQISRWDWRHSAVVFAKVASTIAICPKSRLPFSPTRLHWKPQCHCPYGVVQRRLAWRWDWGSINYVFNFKASAHTAKALHLKRANRYSVFHMLKSLSFHQAVLLRNPGAWYRFCRCRWLLYVGAHSYRYMYFVCRKMARRRVALEENRTINLRAPSLPPGIIWSQCLSFGLEMTSRSVRTDMACSAIILPTILYLNSPVKCGWEERKFREKGGTITSDRRWTVLTNLCLLQAKLSTQILFCVTLLFCWWPVGPFHCWR